MSGIVIALRPIALSICAMVTCASPGSAGDHDHELDQHLRAVLHDAGLTGRIESSLERRLGRPLSLHLADLGRLLWFDVIGGLHSDNTCGGCHSPTNGMGDSQSIAIGIQNNNLVGPHRTGPRNQRRTPSVVNTAFYPGLMWNARFSAKSGNPFDNSMGFHFPPPEGDTRFPADDPVIAHLLIAQGHMPPTELVEVAGFTGTAGTIGPRFDIFDDGKGDNVPPPDATGFRNEPIRQVVLARLNGSLAYRKLFGRLFPSIAAGGEIDFSMFARAIAEFEFTLVFADAPIDRFARGDSAAMTVAEKKGALLFFGEAGCVSCHAVSGESNEMFSDFKNHVAGGPQIAPFFGVGEGNVIFDGPGEDEDFGLEQVTGDPLDRYKFRTSPLRNAAVQAAFFHNGAFTKLEDAIRYHLNAPALGRAYNATAAGVARDLRYRTGPMEPVIARIDPLLQNPPRLSQDEFQNLVLFVEFGLLDARAEKQNLCRLPPSSLPSGLHTLHFERCSNPK